MGKTLFFFRDDTVQASVFFFGRTVQASDRAAAWMHDHNHNFHQKLKRKEKKEISIAKSKVWVHCSHFTAGLSTP